MSCDGQYPWWDRFIAKAHTEIECDPSVWSRVESLIRDKLPPPTSSASVLPVADTSSTVQSRQ